MSKLEVVLHEAEEGGYWAEVPMLPGCVSEGETLDEVCKNVVDAVLACLEVRFEDEKGGHDPNLERLRSLVARGLETPLFPQDTPIFRKGRAVIRV